MTIWQTNAQLAATTDRDQAADHVLNAAVRETVAAYRHALRAGVSLPVAEAAAALRLAGEKAARMLGSGS